MTILEEIIMYKKLDIATRKRDVRIEDLENNPRYKSPIFSLKAALQDETKTGIIAEFKRKSPSKGIINDKADILETTKAFTQHGATGLSILTDEKFFGGTTSDLMTARENNIPILQKDFIVDEYQVIEARSIGADIVLLIATCLTPAEVKALATFAKSLELEVLLEIHNEKELEHICDEIDMVGVNNRDLETFEVKMETSLLLAEKIPGKIKIAESGIDSAGTIRLFREKGFKGFLVGEHFMKAEDPGKAFEEFVAGLK